MRRHAFFYAAFFGLAFAAAETTRGTDFISGSGTGGTVNTSTIGGSDVVLGWQITVGSQALSVTALGAWDMNNDGLESDMRVGVWETNTATLIGQVIVPAGSGADFSSGFRFTSLDAPVILNPNTDYTFGLRIVGPNGTRTTLRFASDVP